MLSDVPDDVTRSRLTLPAAVPEPRVLALAGDTLALARDATLTVVELPRGAVAATFDLPWEIDHIEVSPSGRWIAAAPGWPRREIARCDRVDGTFAMVGELPGGHIGGYGFVGAGGHELLLASRDRYTFSVLDAQDLGELARVEGRNEFGFDGFHAVGEATVCALGHFPSDARDALVIFDLNAAIDDPASLPAKALHDRDIAYRLIAGPAGPDAFVAFRDPEDDEDPDPDDEYDHLDFPHLGSLRAHLGLYVRSAVTFEVLDAIAWDGPVRRGDECFATEAWIAVAMRAAGVALVARTGGSRRATLVAGTLATTDPASRRVALLDASGELLLLQL